MEFSNRIFFWKGIKPAGDGMRHLTEEIIHIYSTKMPGKLQRDGH